MLTLIGVSEFVDETRDDYNSPITSTFVSRMQQCRNTITALEEVSYLFPHRKDVTSHKYLIISFPAFLNCNVV